MRGTEMSLQGALRLAVKSAFCRSYTYETSPCFLTRCERTLITKTGNTCLYVAASKEQNPGKLIGGLLFYFAERKGPHNSGIERLFSPLTPPPHPSAAFSNELPVWRTLMSQRRLSEAAAAGPAETICMWRVASWQKNRISTFLCTELTLKS